MSRNYYALLEVPKNATKAEIKAAFKAKAFLTHPDKTHEETADAMRRLKEARDTLLDNDKRRDYDIAAAILGDMDAAVFPVPEEPVAAIESAQPPFSTYFRTRYQALNEALYTYELIISKAP